MRFGGEGEAFSSFDVVERLDTERIAGKDQALGGGVIDRDCVHTAEEIYKGGPAAAIEVKRYFAVRAGCKGDIAELIAELRVIVDFTISDQDGALFFIERLIAGFEINYCEAGLDQTDIARNIVAVTIRTPMRKSDHKTIEQANVQRPAAPHHYSRDATHAASVIFHRRA